jgi:hydroxycarboxylate dehydrogenase B
VSAPTIRRHQTNVIGSSEPARTAIERDFVVLQLTVDHAVDVAATVLTAIGAPPESAARVGRWLINADRAGHPSHGIIRLIDYDARERSGDLDPSVEPYVRSETMKGPTVLVDGRGGFGHLAAHEMTRAMVERVETNPIVLGGIVNASHTGRLGEWAEQAVASDVIFCMGTASLGKGNVAAYGAREPRLGTNPITFGIPGSEDDSLILDYATSQIAGGKIQHLIAAGESAPEGSLIDKDGNPSVDPADWLDGGMLLPFGGHKGYGLSLVISLLSGCLVGQEAADLSRGVFAIAIDPGAFADRDLVLGSVRGQLERMRATSPAPGFERVEVPGDFERRNRERFGDSIEIPDATWDDIVLLGKRLGLDRDLSPES